MRRTQIPQPLLALLAILLSTNISLASPLPRDETSVGQQNHTLELRDCALLCGWTNQLCCASGQQCLTVAGQATCGAAAAAATGYANGQWLMFTTTYTKTDLITVTTVYSSYIPISTSQYAPVVQTQVITSVVQAPAPTQASVCKTNFGESPCGGTLCCAPGQFCAYIGQCQAAGGSSSNGNGYVAPVTTGSAFIRPTSATTATVIFTGTATTTVPFQTPIGTDGSAITGVTATAQNNGLSGGAIAGIVIGVLAAIFLLFLFCACCLAKELLESVLGIFGLGKKRKRRVTDTTIIEERHSRHSGGRVTGGRRTWFGTTAGPSRPQQKKSSGWGGALGVAGALGTLALLLGLKRKNKPDEKSSSGTGSNYTYSSYSSESEF